MTSAFPGVLCPHDRTIPSFLRNLTTGEYARADAITGELECILGARLNTLCTSAFDEALLGASMKCIPPRQHTFDGGPWIVHCFDITPYGVLERVMLWAVGVDEKVLLKKPSGIWIARLTCVGTGPDTTTRINGIHTGR